MSAVTKFIILVLAFVLVFQRAVVQADETALLHLSEASLSPVNLGATKLENGYADRSFRLKNDTTERVKLLEVKLSCSCASATVQSHVLEAGQETTIDLKLQSSVGGTQSASMSILWDNGTSYRIPMEWTVLHQLSFEPRSVDFGAVSPTGSYRVDMKVRRYRQQESYIPDGVELSVSDPNTLSAKYSDGAIEVQLTDCGLYSANGAYLYVTDAEMEKGVQVAIPIKWQLKQSSSHVMPSSLFIRDGRSSECNFLLVGKDGELPDLEGLQCDGLEVERWSIRRINANRMQVSIKFAETVVPRTKVVPLNFTFEQNAYDVSVPVTIKHVAKNVDNANS